MKLVSPADVDGLLNWPDMINAIETAFGYITGIVKSADLITGRINPTTAPYCQPQINPQRSTGMCIGKSIFPIC